MVTMIRPAAMIVLTAVEKQKLSRWERATTTPQLWRDARASFSAVPPDSVHGDWRSRNA
jgi:hypothetical protein